jgi:hypothetical protein
MKIMQNAVKKKNDYLGGWAGPALRHTDTDEHVWKQLILLQSEINIKSALHARNEIHFLQFGRL